MRKLALLQMRQSLPRLVAAGIAIVIGTAFVALTVLAGNAMATTTTAALTAQYANADLVIRSGGMTQAELDLIRATPGVAAADPVLIRFGEFTGTGRNAIGAIVPAASHPSLQPQELVEGAWPDAPGQITLPEQLAERLGFTVGDSVPLAVFNTRDTDPVTGEITFDPVRSAVVVGLTSDPFGAYSSWAGAAVAYEADVLAWEREIDTPRVVESGPLAGTPIIANELSVALLPGADVPTIQAELNSALSALATGGNATVVTPTELANQMAANMMGGQNLILTVFVGVFAAIALLVAGLVIANTFQVLVAQRTRDLALLRAVGASSAQVRASVLWEALALGVIASGVGLLVGLALGAIALRVAGGMVTGLPLPRSLTITPAVLVAPLLIGILVTLVAALAPARAATRVSPLAAMRPLDAPSIERRAGRVRLVLALLATAGGFVMLFGAVRYAATALDNAVLLAVAGSIISFLGLVVSAVFWLPVVVGAVGSLLARTGSTAKLAVANTLRNPRRTTATATALLIGTTLVAMMATGAATASATFETVMDGTFPVDVVIATDRWTNPETAEPIPDQLIAEIGALAGVAAVVPVPGATVTGALVAGPPGAELTVRGVSPADASSVVRDSAQIAALADGVLLVPMGGLRLGEWVNDGDLVTLSGPSGSVELTVRLSDLREGGVLVTPETLAALNSDAPTTRVWLGLERVGDATTVVPLVSDAVSDSGVGAAISGAAADRASVQNLIDTALTVVVALLAAAVVIALIGVANTLSLSVIERQRESATLRAIGLSQGGLRRMLALEGVLIAVVGALLGILLGLIYGWVGATTVLSQTGDVVLGVPWVYIGLALLIAVAAGLLASILPGRAAARAKPVEALATL
ncbi:MAG: ABC transporter permease [Promicromonosporaceae bacterium]|nr:ABC transporter permease [Promicromonosporaceae bacterium]